MPLKPREQHTGRFLIGIVIVMVLSGFIAGEFYFLLWGISIDWLGTEYTQTSEDMQKDAIAADPHMRSFHDPVHGISFQYPKEWVLQEDSNLNLGPDFITYITETQTLDKARPTISFWYVKNTFGLDTLAGTVREEILKNGETIQEDVPANGQYVFGAYKPMKDKAGQWTWMHAKYLVPMTLMGGSSGEYLVVEATDDLDSWEKTLGVVGAMFKTLKKSP